MICPFCGAIIEQEGAKYCGECGSSIESVNIYEDDINYSNDTSLQEFSVDDEDLNNNNKRRVFAKIMLCIIIIVFALFLVLGLEYLLM